MTSERFLLDTCAVIWIVAGAPLSMDMNIALSRIKDSKDALFVSSMSAWEIGMLVAKGRLSTTKNARAWFQEAVQFIDAGVLDLSLSSLVDSSFLPAPIHNDPTDRILIAAAREHNLTIMTRDRAILSYGAAGHVRTLAC